MKQQRERKSLVSWQQQFHHLHDAWLQPSQDVFFKISSLLRCSSSAYLMATTSPESTQAWLLYAHTHTRTYTNKKSRAPRLGTCPIAPQLPRLSSPLLSLALQTIYTVPRSPDFFFFRSCVCVVRFSTFPLPSRLPLRAVTTFRLGWTAWQSSCLCKSPLR